jgi:hypothetical protein
VSSTWEPALRSIYAHIDHTLLWKTENFIEKQHHMWILEMLHNNVASDMNAFEEEAQGNGIIHFYVFL